MNSIQNMNFSTMHCWLYNQLERLKDGKIHMCFFSRSNAFYKPTPVRRKSTFRYNSMFNFILVSFCFLLILGLGLGLGSVIGLGLGFRV